MTHFETEMISVVAAQRRRIVLTPCTFVCADACVMRVRSLGRVPCELEPKERAALIAAVGWAQVLCVCVYLCPCTCGVVCV
jgi:hypothetical protein